MSLFLMSVTEQVDRMAAKPVRYKTGQDNRRGDMVQKLAGFLAVSLLSGALIYGYRASTRGSNANNIRAMGARIGIQAGIFIAALGTWVWVSRDSTSNIYNSWKMGRLGESSSRTLQSSISKKDE